jgi:hypothetical protein
MATGTRASSKGRSKSRGSGRGSARGGTGTRRRRAQIVAGGPGVPMCANAPYAWLLRCLLTDLIVFKLQPPRDGGGAGHR